MRSWSSLDSNVFEMAPAALAVVDAASGEILAANRALAQRLDTHADLLVGLVWPTPLGGTRRGFDELCEQLVADQTLVVEQQLGERIDPVWWRQAVTLVDDGPSDPYLIIHVEDRTLEHRVNVDLSRAAHRDELTGLWNRRKFRHDLRMALAPNRSGWLGLVLFDVNDFKQVNDTYGHPGGDAALVAVAATLAAIARREAVVARLSGDEFAVLVKGSSEDAVIEHCREIVARTATVPIGDVIGDVSLSAGWAVARPGPDSERRAQDLLIEADVAMYAAKTRSRVIGRQAIGLHGDVANVGDLWDPDRGGGPGLELWSHPVIATSTGSFLFHDIAVHGYEGPLTLTALVHIIEMLRRHSARRVGEPVDHLVHLPDFPLGVVSAVPWLTRAATDAGLDPSLVTFALTEAHLLHAGPAAYKVLTAMRADGFGLAIDDFGAEIGSLRLLADLRPDQVWLAPRLVELHATSGASDAQVAVHAIVDSEPDPVAGAILDLARRLGVAVGVAGVAHGRLAHLAEIGVSLALVPDPSALRPAGVVAAEHATG